MNYLNYNQCTFVQEGGLINQQVVNRDCFEPGCKCMAVIMYNGDITKLIYSMYTHRY